MSTNKGQIVEIWIISLAPIVYLEMIYLVLVKMNNLASISKDCWIQIIEIPLVYETWARDPQLKLSQINFEFWIYNKIIMSYNIYFNCNGCFKSMDMGTIKCINVTPWWLWNTWYFSFFFNFLLVYSEDNEQYLN